MLFSGRKTKLLPFIGSNKQSLAEITLGIPDLSNRTVRQSNSISEDSAYVVVKSCDLVRLAFDITQEFYHRLR